MSEHPPRQPRSTRRPAPPSLHSPPSLSPLIEILGLDQLIPPTLSHWLPLVSEGLSFFLAHLPEDQQARIVSHSLALTANPENHAAHHLVGLLMQCPTLHKLGQVIARHPQLDPDLRRQLQRLETLPATTDPAHLHALIRDELTLHHGPDALQDIELEDMPLAEGSVAVVLPFRYPQRGEYRKNGEGVFKLLKPGVRERLDAELTTLAGLGPWLAARSRELNLPPVDYTDLLQTVHRLMMSEVRLDIEQDNLQLAAGLYGHLPLVQIPALLPWSTPNMTAMTRIHGQKITDADLSPHQRRQLAQTLVSVLLGQPFWNREERALVHADLHAGNLFITEDGQLAVLDWSLTATLTRAQRQTLVSIILGGILLDADRIRYAIAGLSSLKSDDPGLIRHVETALDRIALQGQSPGFDWLLRLFDDLALYASASFWDDFVLLRKSWQSLSGVIHDLAGKTTSPDLPLTRLALQNFLAELPDRTISPPDSEAFSTHLSNLDLLTLAASPALVSLRWWKRWMHRKSETPGQARY